MKKICTIILILAGITYSYAQSKIEGYEYWFNNDFANKTTTNVAPTQQLLVNQSVSVTGLTSGVHTFNFRSFDDKGKYSAVISSFFYKPSALESSPNPEITAYEYWVDNSYGDAVLVNTAAQQQLSIDELISMSSLPNGIHVFNIRFKDSRGLWSSTTSEFFYKMPPPAPGSSNLVSYEYWFDNDYQNAVTANTPVQSPVVINEMVDAQTLPAGIHIFNIRFKDDRGLWSSTTSEFFYKMAAQSVTNNLIVGYRYWLNDDFENATVEALETPVKQFSLIDNLDFTSIPKGDYTISFQFKDTLGLWSSVTTDSIAKVSLPISNFTYTTQVECDSTIAYFTNLSVDADDYLWEFGDGNSSTLANPIHTYYTPSTYQVSLTVTDTLMGTDSTMVLPMEIISLNTDSTITATACDSYTAPDGEVYTTSGIKTAVIPNAAGCDSTITIDLTILHSTASSITATACDSYTAPDGEVYTTSGIKTAVIPNAAGCDSTITIDLTILHSTASSITETACDSYTAPDGEVYTTSGIKTAVIPNAAGCDSTITIDLTILHSTASSITETACDSYTAPDGEVYTTSGIKTAIIPNAAGCDSTITIDLTILHSTASSITATACDSYTAPDGEVYTTSGIKTAVIPNAAGCDSTITIDLTILHSTASSITATACDSYTAPDGEVYTTSGIKTAVIPNAAGCDSTITIDLTILHSTASSITATACDSYTAPDGEVYTTSGIKTAVIPNAAGCNSTITIDLTIINVDVSVTQDGITLTANATDASYQWLDCDNDYSAIAGETEQSFTATQNGNYAVEVTQDICVATSDCFAVTGVGVIENTFANEIIVYPNPTRDIVKVDLGKVLDEFTVIINDVNGKLVRKSTYKDTQTLELNLDVQPGIYLMTISSGDKKVTIKLIKN